MFDGPLAQPGDRRDARRRSEQRRRGRRAPRLRAAGPGINDDGSGTATLLAQAQELAAGHYNLRQKIRFAWWGAEENGLVGSSYYAENLSDKEVAKIDVMLDYDMLASPNYIRGDLRR